jgi:hypothetical protein
VFENRVLRKIFGPKGLEVTGDWRTVHNEKLHGLYSSPHIIQVIKSRRMRWAGHVARKGKDKVHTVFVIGKLESQRTLGLYKRGWENNIKMDLQTMEWGPRLD